MSTMKIRKMKVYYAHRKRAYTRYPVIRIGGDYLSLMDYNVGDEIEVVVDKKQIVIRKSHVLPKEMEPYTAKAQPAKDTLV